MKAIGLPLIVVLVFAVLGFFAGIVSAPADVVWILSVAGVSVTFFLGFAGSRSSAWADAGAGSARVYTASQPRV